MAVCQDSHDIAVSYLGKNSESDVEVARQMTQYLRQSVKRAYDTESVRGDFHTSGIDPIIAPKRGAILNDLETEPWMKNRNDSIRAIAGLGNNNDARALWKILAGYHRRSLGETAFCR